MRVLYMDISPSSLLLPGCATHTFTVHTLTHSLLAAVFANFPERLETGAEQQDPPTDTGEDQELTHTLLLLLDTFRIKENNVCWCVRWVEITPGLPLQHLPNNSEQRKIIRCNGHLGQFKHMHVNNVTLCDAWGVCCTVCVRQFARDKSINIWLVLVVSSDFLSFSDLSLPSHELGRHRQINNPLHFGADLEQGVNPILFFHLFPWECANLIPASWQNNSIMFLHINKSHENNKTNHVPMTYAPRSEPCVKASKTKCCKGNFLTLIWFLRRRLLWMTCFLKNYYDSTHIQTFFCL